MVMRGTNYRVGKVLLVNSDPEIIQILEINLTNAEMEVITARSGKEALSKLRKEETDLVILDSSLPDIGHAEMCQNIREMFPLKHVPVVVIGTRSPKYQNHWTDSNVIYSIAKPFEPKEVVALVRGYLTHKERTINTSLLTGLPNRIQVGNEISRLLQQKATIAAIYITMHDISGIYETYGDAQGDSIIQLLGNAVSEAVRLFGNPSDLVGHFGGDKFLVVSSPWKARTLCRRIIADYHRRIKLLYSDEHLQTGYTPLKGFPENKDHGPNMSIHVAVVTNQKRSFSNHLEVIETAMEQVEQLKQSLESNCYFDLDTNIIGPSFSFSSKETQQVYKENVRAMRGIFAWFDFLTRELHVPIDQIKNSLGILNSKGVVDLNDEQQRALKSLHDDCRRLVQIVEDFAGLARAKEFKPGFFDDEVDIREILKWVTKQVEDLARKQGIKIDVEGAGEIGRIIWDKKTLAQSLLYVIRSEIMASPGRTRIRLNVSSKDEEYIVIEVSCQDDDKPGAVSGTFVSNQSNSLPEMITNELYLSKVLLLSMGGDLEVNRESDGGINCIVTIPEKWRSWAKELDALQLAMEISRKEAREVLKNTNHAISSLSTELSSDVRDNLDRLDFKLQELAVLCNRSLYLADDYNARLEIQQDLMLQRETEQQAVSEAILLVCRAMAAKMRDEYLFNTKTSKKVANYSLALAKELKMSESECQTLYYAALFRDLALAFVRRGSGGQPAIINCDQTSAVNDRLHQIWKALSTVPFLSSACNLIVYRWENFDGTGGSFGVKGTDIPLGSRILAVADTFQYLTSDRSVHGALSPEKAIQQIVESSGIHFDPRVVSTLVMLWKRKQIKPVLIGD